MVRNSCAHFEDRIRGLGKQGKELNIKPNKNHIEILEIENLSGNIFRTTMENGECGEIEVSEKNLDILATLIQDIINNLPWLGWRNHYPKA